MWYEISEEQKSWQQDSLENVRNEDISEFEEKMVRTGEKITRTPVDTEQ